MGLSGDDKGTGCFCRSACLLTLLLSLLIPLTSHAQLTVTAYDGFNYSAGALNNQNGGSGWSTAWTNDYASGTGFNVSSTGMSYPGLTNTGGNITWTSGGNGISASSRTLPLINTGIIYIQFLSQFGATSGGGTPNLRLFSGGTLTGGVGANGGTYGSVISILDTTLSPAANGSSSSSANISSLNFIVVRIDFAATNTALWVNPNLATFDYQNPGAPNATYANLAPQFDKLAFYSRNPGIADELTILSMQVPEPNTAALLFLGIAIALFRRRSRGIFEAVIIKV
jgi:hypothetical protein